MKATVTYNGAQYSYPDGPKLPGLYVTPFKASGDIEFHLGRTEQDLALADRLTPFHMNGYHVLITDGDTVLRDQDIPLHVWRGTWLHRQKGRPQVIRTPQQVVAALQAFPMGPTGSAEPALKPYTSTFTGPLSRAWITDYMPTTGERGDIGLVTEAIARWFRTGDPTAMIDGAEASLSLPWRHRDEKTGKPVDLLKYPTINGAYVKGTQGYPWLAPAPTLTKEQAHSTPQVAHHPSLCYEAFLATHDPNYLEHLGYIATWCFIADAAGSHVYGKAVINGERRGIAWAYRDLFEVHAATLYAESLGPLPEGCHPSSYWKQLLDQCLAYDSSFMSNPICKAFNITNPPQNDFSPWMQDYRLSGLSIGLLTGHADWEDNYLFNLGNLIYRYDNKHGWPSAAGSIYRFGLTSDGKTPWPSWRAMFDAMSGVGAGVVTDSGFTQEMHDKLLVDPTNGYVAVSSPSYMEYTNAVFNMADYLDKTVLKGRIRATYPDFDTCRDTAHRMFLNRNSVALRHTFISVPVAAPGPTPQPQPPNGVPPMADNLSALATAVHAITNVKDSAVAALSHLQDRLAAMVAAATGAGTQVDPAELQALVDELNADRDALATAIANVPAA